MTIDAQIKQITLMQRAKAMYRKKPTLDDYDFINDRSDRLMVAFKLPSFIINLFKTNFSQFLEDFKKNLVGTLIPFDMEESNQGSYDISERNTTSFISPTGYKSTNITKSMIGHSRGISASVIDDTYDPLIDKNVSFQLILNFRKP